MTRFAGFHAQLGKQQSVRELKLLHDSVFQQSDYLARLIDAARHDDLAQNATWLIKHHLSHGGSLAARQHGAILDILFDCLTWQPRLHLLQSIPFLRIPESRKERLRQHIDRSLASRNKFVRAWTYNAAHVLACQYPEYRHEIDRMLESALHTEVPSAVARIRAVLKQRKN